MIGPAVGPAPAAWTGCCRSSPTADCSASIPKGTRSPDGRLYKGKTGVARLVLQAGVPVIPVAMIDTEFVPTRFLRIPLMRRPKIKIGAPLDFRAYAAAGNDREVLRWVTDTIMDAVMQLSGQEYVDAYGVAVKAALRRGEPAPPSSPTRPGEGLRTPPAAGSAAMSEAESSSGGRPP